MALYNTLLILSTSQAGYYHNDDENLPFFYLEEENIFSISSSDISGNSKNRSFQVVYDSESPNFNLIKLTDQAGFDYDIYNLNGPVNITNAQIWVNMPSDSRHWCLKLLNTDSNDHFEDCNENNMAPLLFNQSTGFPINGISLYENYSDKIIQMNIPNLENGDYEMSLEVTDWANNTILESWLISFDTILPIVSWNSNPSEDFLLNSHLQNLSWDSSEDVRINFSLNGESILLKNNSNNGYLNFQLNNTGVHLLCFEAIDNTFWHENYNVYRDCKSMLLDSSIYDTQVSTFTNEGLVSSDSLQVILQRESTQEIRWYRINSNEVNFIPPGEDVVVLNIELEEGYNEFKIEIYSLNETDEYSITLVKDSKAPNFSFSEYNFRNSPLNTLKTLEGFCEANLPVTISSDLENHDFICPNEGNFSIDISIPSESGIYEIVGFTTDEANNRADYQINVEKQDWGEWAIEDIKEQGPIFIWSVVPSTLLLIIILTNYLLSRRKKTLNL
ncbi:MAG: hypothetical protein ACJZ4F_05340 [Candidatus Thalassarchaeaceae archaeon]